MSRSLRIPAGFFDSRRFGFAQVAVVATPFGDAVHVAGQVAWDADCNIVGAGNIGRQLAKSLENLAAALASVSATLDQVGSLRGKVIGDVLKAVFGDNPPCSTWIGVPCLAVEDFLVEVEPSVVFLPRPAPGRAPDPAAGPATTAPDGQGCRPTGTACRTRVKTQ